MLVKTSTVQLFEIWSKVDADWVNFEKRGSNVTQKLLPAWTLIDGILKIQLRHKFYQLKFQNGGKRKKERDAMRE